ncbi:MAG TPA: NifU family protein [Gemmatimonadales bacterium]|jgi:Fe-S cluster biogenesis protein NfuA
MDTLSRIEQALDGLRPYIASHKGSVEVIDYDDTDGTLTLRMGGTCHGCAASSITLKKGIEVRLRESVPEVRTVQAI